MHQTRKFACEPASVGAARRFATRALDDARSDVLEAVELMVSELATNCVRHANTAFELNVVLRRGEIRIEVTDLGGGTPAMRSPGPDDPTGRGLQIVNMLSETWGVEHRASAGNTVWFTLLAPATGDQLARQGGSPAPCA